MPQSSSRCSDNEARVSRSREVIRCENVPNIPKMTWNLFFFLQNRCSQGSKYRKLSSLIAYTSVSPQFDLFITLFPDLLIEVSVTNWQNYAKIRLLCNIEETVTFYQGYAWGVVVLVMSQVAQARYMSSSMLTFASFRNSSDLNIYKDLYGK